jgi:anti-anti-sigma regulatory factor/anti-sigma regulatory factor (Ser/Thr protein kinase)
MAGLGARNEALLVDLRCTVERREFCTVIHINGQLDFITSPVLRQTFLKALADEPELIVLDLAGMRVVEDVALTAFLALARHAEAWPGCPVVLAAARAQVTEALERMAVCRYLPLFRTTAEALTQADRHPVPTRLRARLEPTPEATTTARAVVEEACRTWHLAHVVDVAQLVVTELVSNVVQHARTPMEVSAALRDRYLHLSVRDRSFDLPRRGGGEDVLREDGRGLLVVEALTTGWGTTPTDDGKVVWATLRIGRTEIP